MGLVRASTSCLAPQHNTLHHPMPCHNNITPYRRCRAIICSTDAKSGTTRTVCLGECATTLSASMCTRMAVLAPLKVLFPHRFIDYAPYVWHRLRQSYGIDDEDYLRSIGSVPRAHTHIPTLPSLLPILPQVAVLTPPPARPGSMLSNLLLGSLSSLSELGERSAFVSQPHHACMYAP